MNNKNDKVRKDFRELQVTLGSNIDDVIQTLMLAHENGDKIYCNFNGHMLYSDETTIESTYQKLFGASKLEHERKIKRFLKKIETPIVCSEK